MANDVTVTNQKDSFVGNANPDYVVDTTEMSDGSHKQHVGIDISADGTPSRVTASNPLPITSSGIVDSNNSTSTPLGISGVFTGTATEVLAYGGIIISAIADEDSAADGLSIQFSSDGTNWDHIEAHTVTADTSHISITPPQARYMRVVYTNGTTAQTSFRLQTLLVSESVGPVAELLGGDISDTTIAQSVRAVLAAKKPNGDYANISSTAGGNLKVSVEEFDPSVFGQETMANSLPVTIASDQTAIPITDNGGSITVDGAVTATIQEPLSVDDNGGSLTVDDGGSSLTVDGTVAATQSGTWDITNISGTVSLPTGAATAANQTTANTSLSTIAAATKLEDAAHASGDRGIPAWTRRIDTVASSAGTSGDYATLNTDANGRLYTADTRTGSSSQQIQGAAANLATPGNPVQIAMNLFAGGGVQGVPDIINFSGVNYQLNLVPDTALNFVSYTSAGEQYCFVGSTDGTKANATYVRVDSSDRVLNSVQSSVTTLTNISTTYDNVTTTATSGTVTIGNAGRMCALYFALTKANTPTDIRISVLGSVDNTNFGKCTNGFLGSWIYDDTYVGASGIQRTLLFPANYSYIQIQVTATGTTASNTFTIANAKLEVRD